MTQVKGRGKSPNYQKCAMSRIKYLAQKKSTNMLLKKHHKIGMIAQRPASWMNHQTGKKTGQGKCVREPFRSTALPPLGSTICTSEHRLTSAEVYIDFDVEEGGSESLNHFRMTICLSSTFLGLHYNN